MQCFFCVPTMLLLPPLLALVLLTTLTQCTSIVCSSNLYGQPSASDVAAVAQAMPYVKSDPDGEMDATRTFAEPAFFTRSFSALKNSWPTRMVQLPLIWRFSGFPLCALRGCDLQIMEGDEKPGSFADYVSLEQDRLAWRYSRTRMPLAT